MSALIECKLDKHQLFYNFHFDEACNKIGIAMFKYNIHGIEITMKVSDNVCYII